MAPSAGPRAIDGKSVTVSAGSAAAVTPNDGADLPATTRGLYVGSGGAVAVILDRDTASVTFTGVNAGTILPIRATRVLSTGTTASAIIALY